VLKASGNLQASSRVGGEHQTWGVRWVGIQPGGRQGKGGLSAGSCLAWPTRSRPSISSGNGAFLKSVMEWCSRRNNSLNELLAEAETGEAVFSISNVALAQIQWS